MKKVIGRIVLWLLRFRVDTNIPPEAQRCVMTAAPHTSNWDFFVTMGAFWYLGIPLRFTVKQSWTNNLFVGWLIKALGGLGIDRSPKKPGEERLSMVDAMAELFEKHERLAVVVTPEGTRSLRTKWKSGFYWVAHKAKVPVCMGYLDYKKRVGGVEGPVIPSGDFDKDFPLIQETYRYKHPKRPEKFSLDTRYDSPEKSDAQA